MDVDLSRAGGMSRLLRQGKASEHSLHWTDLRWVMAFLTRYKGPSRWLSRTAERLPMCPRTVLARGRHQSAITHVSALNARRLQGPLVPLWPFTTIGAATTLPGDSRHCKLDK
jgi:hypothetical protein